MSKKTLRKRIALVAASALGAGLISVVAVPVANAAITPPSNLTCTATTSGEINLSWTASAVSGNDTAVSKYTYSTNGGTTYKDLPVGSGATTTTRTITQVSTAGTALSNGTIYLISLKGVSVNATDGAQTSNASNEVACATGIPNPAEMYVATTASTTGSADQASGLSVGAKSLGWVSQTSSTATSRYNGLILSGSSVATGVVLSGAKLAFNATSTVTSTDSLGVVVTGGTISGLGCLNAGTASLNGSATTAACVQASTTRSTLYGVLDVSAAVGKSATISVYKGTGITGTSTATNGTLIGSWSFTVAAANVAATYSAGDSSIYVQTPMAKGGTASGSSGFDYALRANNGEVHVVYVALKDAYGSALADADIAALTAATTNGATVNIVDTPGASDSYAATAAFDTEGGLGSDGIGYVVVNQPTANTAGSSVLTLTLDGTVIATKTLNWNGDIASLAIVESSSAKTFLNPTTFSANAGSPAVAVKNIVYVAKDAAGNVLTLGSHPAISDESGSMVGASLSTVDAGTGAITDDSALQTQAIGYGVATMLIPNSTLRGAGEYRIKITNAAGATIKSQAVKTTVTGAVNTFTAAWDKTTYAPGEIATLTITGLDSGGRPVGTGVALGSTALVTTNTDGLASVTSSCDAANIVTATTAYYIDGVKTCKFAVKNTEGAYAYTVVVANASSQAAIAGTINVKATTSAVTNAEVLAAIVKLIASINKQIRALQKSLRR